MNACGTCDAGEDRPVHGEVVELKTCSKCGVEKPLTEFSLVSHATGRRRGACTPCRTNTHREWLQQPHVQAARKTRADKERRLLVESSQITAAAGRRNVRGPGTRVPTLEELTAWYRRGCPL